MRRHVGGRGGTWGDANASIYAQQNLEYRLWRRMEDEVFTRTVEPQEQERKGVEGRDVIKRVRRICVCIGVRVSPHAVWRARENDQRGSGRKGSVA